MPRSKLDFWMSSQQMPSPVKKACSPLPSKINTYYQDVFKARLVNRTDSPHLTGSIQKRDGRQIVQVRKFINGEATKQGFSTTLDCFKQLVLNGVKPIVSTQIIGGQLLVSQQAVNVIIASIGQEQNRAITGLWLTKKEFARLQVFLEPITVAFKNNGQNGEDSFDEMSAEEDEDEPDNVVKTQRIPILQRQNAKRKNTSNTVAKPRGKKNRVTEEPLDDTDNDCTNGTQLETLYLD